MDRADRSRHGQFLINVKRRAGDSRSGCKEEEGEKGVARTCIGLLGWLSPWNAAATETTRLPKFGSVRSPSAAGEDATACTARREERSGRRLSSAKRVARGDAMAGDAEPPDDVWRWSSTKVADRWMPCFLRYAIAAVALHAGGAGRIRSEALAHRFLGGASS